MFRRPTEAHGTLRSLVGSTWWRYNYGFDAQNDEYGNLLTKGMDPTKVVRAALQGAASVAGLLITTEAMVAEVPRKQAAAPAMPGGGMGGMDF